MTRTCTWLYVAALMAAVCFAPRAASAGVPGKHALRAQAALTGPPVPTSATTSFTFGATGDVGGNAHSSATLSAMKNARLDFVQLLGDLSYGEKSVADWCAFVHTYFASTFPFELLSGNHEDDGTTYSGLIDNFTPCLPDHLSLTGTYAKRFYYDYPVGSSPLARFIMIDPALTFATSSSNCTPPPASPHTTCMEDYSAGSPNYVWLSNTIDAARAAHIPWVIVGMHEVCITTGVSTCQIGEDVDNLLVAKKVDLVLQGHDHGYFRSKQLAMNGTTCTNIPSDSYKRTSYAYDGSVHNLNCIVNDGASGSYAKGAGTVLVVAGAGGSTDESSAGQVYTWRDDNAYFAKWSGYGYNQQYGFLKATVTATSLTADFVPNSTPAAFTDHFTVTASSNPTAARVNWIDARVAGSATVVRWRSPAVNVLGFNLYGGRHGASLNRALILAQSRGHTYLRRYAGRYHSIQLEVVGRDGRPWPNRVTVASHGN